MNRSLRLAQLEIDLSFAQKQLERFQTLARQVPDPADREEARQSAQSESEKIENIVREIDELKRSGIA